MKSTHLTIEGVDPDELPTGFLVSVMAAAEAEQLDVHGISIDRRESNGGRDDENLQ